MTDKQVTDNAVYQLQNIYEALEAKSKGLINDLESLSNFKKEIDSIPERVKAMNEEGRNLKIGIVGEVKAGKSSFLNALVFKGDEVLPKAATPMTAALTKIKYSEEEYVKVEFFKDYDWKEIEQRAEFCDKQVSDFKKTEIEEELRISSGKYLPAPNNSTQMFPGFTSSKHNSDKSKQDYTESRIHPEIKEIMDKTYKDYTQHIGEETNSCKELTEMVQKSGINPYEFLDKTIKIKKNELDDYVGSEGKYSPLVRYTELHLNNPLVKGMEIIDTPGLNDPIVSRSQKTKDFLKDCDVVFILSYVGQFLGEEDINFIKTTLPTEGVAKAIIVGSKLDSGLLDYKEKKSTFKKVLIKSVSNYKSHAKQVLKNVQDDQVNYNILNDLQASIDNNESPIYISSLLYTCAKKIESGQSLADEEANIIRRMQSRFSGFEATPAFLRDLANIDNIGKKIFKEIKDKKEAILTDRLNELSKIERAKLNKLLESINIQVIKLSNELNEYDLEQSKRKYLELNDHLDSIRGKIKLRFERTAIEVQQRLRHLDHAIFGEKRNIELEKKENKSFSDPVVEKSGLFGWTKTTKRYKLTTLTATYNNVAENIRNYIGLINQKVDEEFENIFDTDLLSRQIKEITISKLDLSSKKFNEDDILGPVQNCLEKLKLSPFEITWKEYEEELFKKIAMIPNKDSTEVFKDEQVYSLERIQNDLLQIISEDTKQKLKELRRETENRLIDLAGTFVDDVENRLSNFQSNLKSLIENKEENLTKLEAYRTVILESKKLIKNMVINDVIVG